ncbi:phosphatidate cytidylyltransferase [Parachlamydia acanthamoebae UV-7]|jgi:phosphatidate cytidylyltransferase|uniref:Phosphatidate cytidylyltransferase n=3 Tax=Parachlamydia acanthamoebae TaxID=83552 RepID=F8KXJ8_PARAV|nr:CDP-archaeol synthase [Parachlamydia acanthamoebae]KIA77075.1 Phosphatidate cytidylyltransferase [Parachlamydia acanthamoebae]CCB87221.1 phosphatidate cytidylyltransferase [Parachlamydia acanthamoebae UV-7]
MMTQHLKYRLIYSALAATILIFLISFSQYSFFRPLFSLAVSAIVGVAVWEYYQMAKAKGFQPLATVGIVFSVLYVYAVFLSTQMQDAQVVPEITLGIALLTFFIYSFYGGASPFVNLAITLFGIAYLAIPLSYTLSINYFPFNGAEDGRWWLFYLLLVAKSTDTGAFFTGRLMGKRRMVPYISPKKTWEGAWGGVLTSVAVSVIFYLGIHLFSKPPIHLSFWESIWLAGLISVVAQIGDLAESLLKRDAGIKDSNQLPGLGGVLDIVDSLIFTLPLLYIFLKIH